MGKQLRIFVHAGYLNEIKLHRKFVYLLVFAKIKKKKITGKFFYIIVTECH
jgi:hypothetical protein